MQESADEQERGVSVGCDLIEACGEARARVALHPEDEDVAALLTRLGEELARVIPVKDSRSDLPAAVLRANELMNSGKMEQAEVLLRNHLAGVRHDPPAMHLMAEIAARCGFFEDADRILKKCAEIHPGSARAWAGIGMALHRIASETDKPELLIESDDAFVRSIEIDPDYEDAIDYRAAMLLQMRRLEDSRLAYERLVSLAPHVSWYWMNYGHVLKTIGDYRGGLAANRMAVALNPLNGAAWWNLANLKVARFFRLDLDRMTAALKEPALTDTHRVSIHFSLAKAFDQFGDFGSAADHLQRGSELRTKLHPKDLDLANQHAASVKRVFTREFFDKREGWGDPRPDAIFILGMPRAGSTLVEQILSSHSQIEGTEELFVVLQLGGELAKANPDKLPEQIIGELSEDEIRELGSRFYSMAARHRVTDRPFFTDKNPQNWQYTGLINLMLPNAKIIDIRRNPMDCCFANYAQHFQTGANFSYSLEELGRYYSNYVQTMRYFDEILRGRVHRIIYEDLIENFESEVRRLLNYLELPFEESCLRFFETERPVHTPSSEQVRQPINRSGIDKWRKYEPWLGRLKDSLGQTIESWR